MEFNDGGLIQLRGRLWSFEMRPMELKEIQRNTE